MFLDWSHCVQGRFHGDQYKGSGDDKEDYEWEPGKLERYEKNIRCSKGFLSIFWLVFKALTLVWCLGAFLVHSKNFGAFFDPWRNSRSLAHFLIFDAFLDIWRIYRSLTHFRLSCTFSDLRRISGPLAHFSISGALSDSQRIFGSLAHL